MTPWKHVPRHPAPDPEPGCIGPILLIAAASAAIMILVGVLTG